MDVSCFDQMRICVGYDYSERNNKHKKNAPFKSNYCIKIFNIGYTSYMNETYLLNQYKMRTDLAKLR